jgi:hypothetical protein
VARRLDQNAPSRTLQRPTWIQAIQSNENRPMIGPRSVFPILPAVRSHEASSCIRLFSAANRTIFMRWMISAALIEAFVSKVAFAAGMKAA